MKTGYLSAVVLWLLAGSAVGQEEKVAPLNVEMGGQVYLCGLKAQLADMTKGSKQKNLLAEASACAENSRVKMRSLVKSEYEKYPDGDVMRERIKSLYSAYLSYMSSAMWGKDLIESTEAKAFASRVNDYKSELDLR